jgi:hypothetical protein
MLGSGDVDQKAENRFNCNIELHLGHNRKVGMKQERHCRRRIYWADNNRYLTLKVTKEFFLFHYLQEQSEASGS